MRIYLVYIFVLSFLAMLFTTCDSVIACAPAPYPDQKVAIASESAIIIWDEATQTQHFIRRASFASTAQDFGFLVPTPTQPTLHEASDEAFSLLSEITAPEIIKENKPSGFGCGCSMAQNDMVKSQRVTVLEQKRVAGHDAVVLEATDAQALGDWLQQHGYEFSPALIEWVEPYIAAKWKISAFKIAKELPSDHTIATSAIRMTFTTPRPFFPYREPEASMDIGERLLRVFFISQNRVAGNLEKVNSQWSGRAVWSNLISQDDRERLLAFLKLPLNTSPKKWWLTEFEDYSISRSREDVYFSTSEDQNTIKRPAQIQYVLNSKPDISFFVVAIIAIIPYFLRRRKIAQRAKRG